MKPETKTLDALIEEIAIKNIPAIEDARTLETRGSDSLDFHDISVWCLKKALLAAYEAGRQSR
jgi:hypothetical protein